MTKTPLHAGIICNEYPPFPHGGTGTSYRDLAVGLAARGHQVTVIGVYGKRETAKTFADDTQTGVRVIRLADGGHILGYRLGTLWNRLRLASQLARIHRAAPLDVIEASDYGGWLYYSPTPPGRVPRIVRMRGSNLFFDRTMNRPGDPWEHRLERKSLRRATHIAAVSRYVVDAMANLDALPVNGAGCEVLHNAVDCTRFSPFATDTTEPGRITFVNSVVPKKGVVELLRAFDVVAPQIPHATLHFHGPVPKGTDAAGHTAELLRSHVSPAHHARIHFHGRLAHEEIPSALAKAEVCCLPSHLETFGIAAVEAMAMGKPVIFSRTGPGPEIIEHDVSGLLCDPHDPRDIAGNLLRCLRDPILREALGHRARLRALEKFELQKWIGRNETYFRKCAENRLRR